MHAASALIVQDYVCSAFGCSQIDVNCMVCPSLPSAMWAGYDGLHGLEGILPFATSFALTGHAVSGVVNIGSGGSVQRYSETGRVQN